MKLAILITAIAGLSAGAGIGSRAHVGPACYPADAYTDRQITVLKGTFSSNDPKNIQFLANTHLVAVADTAIEVVSDSTKCARALTTFNSNMDLDTALTRIYLIRAGNAYVGSNPNVHMGREWSEQLVMDSSFAYLATYLR